MCCLGELFLSPPAEEEADDAIQPVTPARKVPGVGRVARRARAGLVDRTRLVTCAYCYALLPSSLLPIHF